MTYTRFGQISALLSVLFMFGWTFAEEPTFADKPEKAAAPETSTRRHNVGGAAGYISGYGLTYRHWGSSKSGYQVTVIPVGRVNEDESFANVSLGGTGLRSLHQTRTTNFFGYYGGHYNFTYNDYTINSPVNAPLYRDSVTTYYSNSGYDQTIHNLYAGGGVGVELHFWNMNYSLMFGYAAKGSFDRYPNGRPSDGSTDLNPSFSMQTSVETALFYCF